MANQPIDPDAWLSRALQNLPPGMKEREIERAHVVDCKCGVQWLLRHDHCSECPSCENEHHFEDGRVVRTWDE